MKQKTAKTQRDVRDWIETTPHHKAKCEPEVGEPEFFVLEGYDRRLRIPQSLLREIGERMQPGDPMDRHMYRWVGEAPE